MQKSGCHSCDADPDLWMMAECRLEDKLEYYSYILCYVDHVLSKLNRYMPFKQDLIRSPDMYLDTKLDSMQLHNGI